MPMNRFKAFVRTVQGDNLRDFTGDAGDDPNLPDASSWQELEMYLKARPGISKSALNAARYVWERYEAEILGKGR